MDPFTLLALAKASYEAVKAGVAVGKEIQGVAKDLGSLFDSVAQITRIASTPARGDLLAGKSAEQVAMESYAAKAEADQLLADLKNTFISEYGLSAWDQVVSETTKIRKAQKAAALQAQKDQAEFVDNVASIMLVVILGLFVLALIFGLLWLVLRH